MVTELETLSFQQLDADLITDWEQVRDLRASFAQARSGSQPFLGIEGFSRWSRYFEFKGIDLKELYLGTKSTSPKAVIDPLLARREWVNGRPLIALKNIASGSLEVFRVEGYPFRVVPGDFGPCNTEYERAFVPRFDTVE
ncbi:hypothetical protein FOC1_g10008141 [Fusarium oxysporum f. sp. cubense race 1]|uniref:Uncharacterized protein n=1 Tax=Fusarium oxysporum f. sp. cubense (strain race 1) TaxID=1229664 RepID=N4TRC4_FUSC1|nr:hypothetical protein FOC1_g10008141 [Fusarium oxysporum f. sp. cubense race 1]